MYRLNWITEALLAPWLGAGELLLLPRVAYFVASVSFLVVAGNERSVLAVASLFFIAKLLVAVRLPLSRLHYCKDAAAAVKKTAAFKLRTFRTKSIANRVVGLSAAQAFCIDTGEKNRYVLGEWQTSP
ncbi:hypothetical protein NPIL_481921 [Nephila pilipes]|uniref:Uncharacterized protein n=1 Tax=Nephila pilipes TaxID=299642 RepID=A0A8X6TZ73_NEPPI|nr:hypothetical protein NPIL_481921 [Nephila pilipes]